MRFYLPGQQMRVFPVMMNFRGLAGRYRRPNSVPKSMSARNLKNLICGPETKSASIRQLFEPWTNTCYTYVLRLTRSWSPGLRLVANRSNGKRLLSGDRFFLWWRCRFPSCPTKFRICAAWRSICVGLGAMKATLFGPYRRASLAAHAQSLARPAKRLDAATRTSRC